ncbi:MAG: hypothetical protein K2O29_08555 [Ruminococcus sp.]|nr:hypothetical protein [Ruminococcus sp.]MDE7138490.1 hypothetical protein [Ruminococcus sp.]
MDKESLYNALTDIDEKYLSEAENFSEISAEFRRAKLRRIGTVFSVCGCSVILVTVLFLSSDNRNISHIMTTDNKTVIQDTLEVDKNDSKANFEHTDFPENTYSTEDNNKVTEAYSSELSTYSTATYNHIDFPESTDNAENDITTEYDIEISTVSVSTDSAVSDIDNTDISVTDEKFMEQPTTSSNIIGYYSPFQATIDPNVDSYDPDNDGICNIEIIIDGIHYSQLGIDEDDSYIIESSVYESDFGEYIGNVVEVNSDNSDYPVYSKEPDLSGAEVYYYAPAGNRTVILVKKSEQCSIFKAEAEPLISSDGEYLSFAETFGYYGAETSADISGISYTISVPENGISVITEQGVISDDETIDSIVNLLNSLSPETDISSTPQWYIDAWNVYKSNPSAYNAESIMIEIILENGTVIKDITHQPFLADGYISGMQALTYEQNKMLRSLLQNH